MRCHLLNKLSYFLIIPVFIISFILFQSYNVKTQELEAPPNKINEGVLLGKHGHFAAGVVIVKFKLSSPLASHAKQLFDKDQDFQSLTENAYLDELNRQYYLKEIIKIQKDNRSIDDIKKKFPKRSQRIPEGAVVPEMGSIYKFIFEAQDIDIEDISQKYSIDEHVEYAQPDYIGTVLNE